MYHIDADMPTLWTPVLCIVAKHSTITLLHFCGGRGRMWAEADPIAHP